MYRIASGHIGRRPLKAPPHLTEGGCPLQFNPAIGCRRFPYTWLVNAALSHGPFLVPAKYLISLCDKCICSALRRGQLKGAVPISLILQFTPLKGAVPFSLLLNVLLFDWHPVMSPFSVSSPPQSVETLWAVRARRTLALPIGLKHSDKPRARAARIHTTARPRPR